MLGCIMGTVAINSTVWIMPVGAEPVGRDGKQLFYATPDGLGSVTPLGDMIDVRLDFFSADDPDIGTEPPDWS